MSYLNVLKNLLAVGGLYEGGSALVDYLRGNPRAAPTSSPSPAAPAAPAVPVGPAAPPPSSAPGSPAAPSSPRLPVTAAAAAFQEMPLPPRPPGEGAQSQQALIERLRERLSANLGNEPLRSVGDIGAGMLASRSPNFFTMLGAGLQAQRTGERERLQDLTTAAKAETEDQYRRDQIAARREQLNDPLNRALVQARIDELQGRGARGAGSRVSLSAAQFEAARRGFVQAANRMYPDPTPGMPDPTRQQEERRAARQQYVEDEMQKLYDRETQRSAGERPSPQQPAPTPQQNVTPVPLTGTIPPRPSAQ